MTMDIDKPLDEVIAADQTNKGRRRGGRNSNQSPGGKVRADVRRPRRGPRRGGVGFRPLATRPISSFRLPAVHAVHPPPPLPQAPRGDGAASGGGRPRSRGSGTPYGVTHRQGQSVADIAAAPSGERTLKVSSTTVPKKLAGSIVLVCEGGEAPMLLPLGAQCVNQAVKAIAIARRDLADADASDDGPTFLSCFPDFRGDDRRSVSMQCDKETKAPWSTSDADLSVGAGSSPASAAGAIAGKIREGLKVGIRACGAEAVSNAVLAVAHARRYLKDDGVDVFFVPYFDKEETADGRERTVVLFRVCKAAGSAPTGK